MGNKKVSVSATPGHTKHFQVSIASLCQFLLLFSEVLCHSLAALLSFQTLYVEPGLCLCDCPGLVMPSFVSTKAEMTCNGILPIDQMRDHVPPISLISFVLHRDSSSCVLGVLVDLHDPMHWGFQIWYLEIKVWKNVSDLPRSHDRNLDLELPSQIVAMQLSAKGRIQTLTSYTRLKFHNFSNLKNLLKLSENVCFYKMKLITTSQLMIKILILIKFNDALHVDFQTLATE